MGTHNVPCCSSEWMEVQCEDNNPRKMTAEGSRHTSDTSQQPSVSRDQTSILKEWFEMMKEMDNKIRNEMFKMMEEMDNKITKEKFEIMEEMDNKRRTKMINRMEEMDNNRRTEMFKMMEEMNNKITENRTLTDPVNMAVHPPDRCSRAFPGRIMQVQHQEKEENERLKEKIKQLEERNQVLLAKVMPMHQHSEDINDPFHLSAVLQRYKMLRLQQWEKVRSSRPHSWTYERGSEIIRKLFDACEKDVQQRTDDICKALDIPHWSSASIKSKQEVMREIRKLLRQPYYQKDPSLPIKIVQEAAILTGDENETEEWFLLECCQIYCLLLLQDAPVKAEWKMDPRYSEHVYKKDEGHWENPSFLWPIMKCGENVIVKGVVWDQNDAWSFKTRRT